VDTIKLLADTVEALVDLHPKPLCTPTHAVDLTADCDKLFSDTAIAFAHLTTNCYEFLSDAAKFSSNTTEAVPHFTSYAINLTTDCDELFSDATKFRSDATKFRSNAAEAFSHLVPEIAGVVAQILDIGSCFLSQILDVRSQNDAPVHFVSHGFG